MANTPLPLQTRPVNGLLIALGAGFLAGGMNAISGGGSFVSFPILVSLGLPSVMANASSTVALFPGAVSGTWAYRRELTGVGPLGLRPLLITSAAGGLVGAGLLLATPTRVFDVIIPWLLLLAAVMFAISPRLPPRPDGGARLGPKTLLALQFVMGLYGGYFGGAVGLIMLAVWSVAVGGDPKKLNPAKTLLVGTANSVAVLCFIAVGLVRWPETLAMMAGAIVGGYAGAHGGRRISAVLLRQLIFVFTLVLTVAFFWRAYR